MSDMINVQPTLINDVAELRPLLETDFEDLYAVACDPVIWEQHPNKERYKREVFEVYFKGALESGGALLISDVKTGQTIGSTRYYDYDAADSSIFIGYTFYATSCWGKGINPKVKKTMIDYITQYVDKVYFHIGAQNIRSQIAIERLGAEKIAEEVVAYYGEPDRVNFKYVIRGSQKIFDKI